MAATSKQAVFLGIIPVTLTGPRGVSITTCALLDNGSTRSFIDQSLSDTLGLKGKPMTYMVTTLTEKDWKHTGQEVNVVVGSNDNPKCVTLTNVWTTSHLSMSCDGAATTTDISRFDHLRDINMHDVRGMRVQLLIGAGSEALIPLEIRSPSRAGQPYAERTMLGWVIRGPSGQSTLNTTHQAEVNFLSTMPCTDDKLNTNVSRLWTTEFNENLGSDKVSMSIEDKKALAIMNESVRIDDGHYEIALPWKDNVDLPCNKSHAFVRLEHVRRRLSNNEQLHRMYNAQMQDYINKGYARKITAEEERRNSSPRRTWYLPHHPVFSEKKPDKVRIVFDGAAKFKGTSINEHLLQGPDLTNSLTGVLTRFRREEVALIADITAMFHQVKTPTEDQESLRFLWWTDGDLTKEPTDYCMTRHVFGLRSSPSCAAFALRQTVLDHGREFRPEMTACVQKNFYVDDLLLSVSNWTDAMKVAKDAHELLSRGGFQLMKWTSNDHRVLEGIPEVMKAQSVRNLNLSADELPNEKTLGISWDPNSDVFQYTIRLEPRPQTKRGILSTVASLFDPLGLVSPITLEPKHILQTLTRLKLRWDDQIPTPLQEQWITWCTRLPAIERLRIPRVLGISLGVSEADSRELHVFCDASEKGYGVCAYLRLQKKGLTSCSLVVGKSRLTPIKPTTIPRMELTAAMLASKVRAQLVEDLNCSLQKIALWTDSMIALGYINNITSRFKPFVANRLATIHELSSSDEWRHVPTKLNPADLASRGIDADDEQSLKRWLQGPEFLLKNPDQWPNKRHPCKIPDDDPDLKATVALIDTDAKTDVMDVFCQHYSTWDRAVRGVAWWRRFCCIMAKKFDEERSEPLSIPEIERAEKAILRATQKRHFQKEMADLKGKGLVNRSSRLAAFDPQMKADLLCTGSRLRFAENATSPILLPYKDAATRLIIRAAHVSNGHVGSEQVLATLRTQYWILKGRAAVRNELANCTHCRRLKTPLCEQQMAPVRKEQVTAGEPPFTYTGVDLFGPFRVKQKRSSVKRYGCIFTCITTRAVHLEIVHFLSAESFLSAISRFTARRGFPRRIFSDRGTNFTAAEKELREAVKDLYEDQTTIRTGLISKRIEWSFNPPHSSHRGGLWERLIRSIRSILRSLIGQQLLTDEGLLTVMAEVERIMNDRPLTPVSSDSKDPEVLTPSSLLLLRGVPSVPLGTFNRDDSCTKRWWRQAQYMSDLFWRRWIREYVPQLIARQKWHAVKENLKPGDVVLVSDVSQPRGKWPLGIVEAVTTGRDDLVRSATVRMAKSTLTRPITQISLLEAV